MKYLVNYFSKGELALWAGSVTAVLAAFLMFDRSSWITLLASLIGVTSLIFAAKGHPAAQAMAIVFALLYGAISWGFAYYGEMITYLGMSMPMAVFSLVSWLRTPIRQERRGEGQSSQGSGIRVHGIFDYSGHDSVLLYPEVFQYRQPDPKHDISNYQLCSGIFCIPAQPALCCGLCGKRRYSCGALADGCG